MHGQARIKLLQKQLLPLTPDLSSPFFHLGALTKRTDTCASRLAFSSRRHRETCTCSCAESAIHVPASVPAIRQTGYTIDFPVTKDAWDDLL
jgi:hypothetical protein